LDLAEAFSGISGGSESGITSTAFKIRGGFGRWIVSGTIDNFIKALFEIISQIEISSTGIT
jgi:uridine kinase